RRRAVERTGPGSRGAVFRRRVGVCRGGRFPDPDRGVRRGRSDWRRGRARRRRRQAPPRVTVVTPADTDQRTQAREPKDHPAPFHARRPAVLPTRGSWHREQEKPSANCGELVMRNSRCFCPPGSAAKAARCRRSAAHHLATADGVEGSAASCHGATISCYPYTYSYTYTYSYEYVYVYEYEYVYGFG